MVIKCPSDRCPWTGELREKEVIYRFSIYTLSDLGNSSILVV